MRCVLSFGPVKESVGLAFLQQILLSLLYAVVLTVMKCYFLRIFLQYFF